MKPFNFQIIQWKCIPYYRHPLSSAYEARRLVREPSCLVQKVHFWGSRTPPPPHKKKHRSWLRA